MEENEEMLESEDEEGEEEEEDKEEVEEEEEEKEEEEEEENPMWGEITENGVERSLKANPLEFKPFEEAGLENVEYAETSFSEGGPIAKELSESMSRNTGNGFDISQEKISTPNRQDPPATPSLPLSPPPGPLLSPRHSFLFGENVPSLPSTPDPSSTMSNSHSTLPDPQSAIKDSLSPSVASNRFSTISLADDTPPPLPSSLPPGKLISPRHSMILSPGPLSLNTAGALIRSSGTGCLDLHQLTAQLAQELGERSEESKPDEREDELKHGQQNNTDSSGSATVENEAGTPPPRQQSQGDQDLPKSQNKVHEQQSQDRKDTLPPFVECNDEEYLQGEDVPPQKGSKLKLTPSFLISLEPPKEFSDSGFLDTDGENASVTPDQNATPDDTDFPNLRQHSPVSKERKRHVSKLVNHLTAGSDGTSTRTGVQLRKDSSTTSYSDERLTEYSGSVGMKTIASSGSPVCSLAHYSRKLSLLLHSDI